MISAPSTCSPVTTTDLWNEVHIKVADSTAEVVRRAMRQLRSPDNSIQHVHIPCPEHILYDWTCEWCIVAGDRARIARNVAIRQKIVEDSIGTKNLDNAYHNFLMSIQEEIQSNAIFERIIYSKGPPFACLSKIKSKKQATQDRASIMENRFSQIHYRVQKLKGEHRHG